VIHAVHTNDVQEMGGLLKKMGKTGWTFIIAALSIAGIFPLSGFWSKDEIVAASSHHPIFFAGTLTIAFMTAFYMFRLVFLTFFGEARNHERYHHAHESPNNMTYPLVFLGFLSIFAGWVGLPWLEHGFAAYVYTGGEPYHPHANWLLMIVSTVVATSGIGLAYLVYYRRVISADSVAAKFAPLYKLLYNKYYIDEIYEVILLKPILAFADFMWKFDARVIDGLVNGAAWFTILWSDIKQWFDTWIVDGAVNGAGWIVRTGARAGRFLQTGKMQFYVLFTLAALVVLGLSKYELAFVEYGFPVMALMFALGVTVLAGIVRLMSSRRRPAETFEREE
jgi:NADH-quinone oxidoreductase subunit L